MTKSHVVKERYGGGGIQSERGDEEYTTLSSVVFESLVWSGLLPSRGKDRDRDWSW